MWLLPSSTPQVLWQLESSRSFVTQGPQFNFHIQQRNECSTHCFPAVPGVSFAACPMCCALAAWILWVPAVTLGLVALGCPPHRCDQCPLAAPLAAGSRGWCWMPKQLSSHMCLMVAQVSPLSHLCLRWPWMTWSLQKAESSLPLEAPLPFSVLPFGISQCCEPAAGAHQSIHRQRWYRGVHSICTGTSLTMPLTSCTQGSTKTRHGAVKCPKICQKRTVKAHAVTSNKQHMAQTSTVRTLLGFMCSHSPDCFGTLSSIPRSWGYVPALCYQVSVKQREQCSQSEPSAKISYQSALAAVNVIIYTAASEVHPLSTNIYMMDLWQMSPFLTLPCIYILK